jgi:undecaprenyl-diphosphatase
MTPLGDPKVGLVQCIALIRGTSRCGATIIGAMIPGLSCRAATRFSFHLAIPALIGAGGAFAFVPAWFGTVDRSR